MKLFSYVMHGRIYRIEGEDAGTEANKQCVYISFGGLLMRLQAEANVLSGLEVDKTIYLLIKKVAVWSRPVCCFNTLLIYAVKLFGNEDNWIVCWNTS